MVTRFPHYRRLYGSAVCTHFPALGEPRKPDVLSGWEEFFALFSERQQTPESIGILGICYANACHADVVFFENDLVGGEGLEPPTLSV